MYRFCFVYNIRLSQKALEVPDMDALKLVVMRKWMHPKLESITYGHWAGKIVTNRFSNVEGSKEILQFLHSWPLLQNINKIRWTLVRWTLCSGVVGDIPLRYTYVWSNLCQCARKQKCFPIWVALSLTPLLTAVITGEDRNLSKFWPGTSRRRAQRLASLRMRVAFRGWWA